MIRLIESLVIIFHQSAKYCTGSTGVPSFCSSKCRCGPVECPAEPTVPICSPCDLRKRIAFYIIQNGRNAFRKFLGTQWKKHPDALSAKMAADLIGILPPRINELVRAGTLHGVIIGNIQYIPKDELIAYAASPAHIAKATSDKYKKLVQEFNTTRQTL